MRGKRFPVYDSLQRRGKSFALSRHPAAQHYNLRTYYVGYVDKPAREIFYVPVDDFAGGYVRFCVFERRFTAYRFGGVSVPHFRTGVLLHSPFRSLYKRGSRRVRLETAPSSARAFVSAELDYHMPELRADGLIAFEKLSADNYAPADARAESHEHAVGVFLTRAETRFAESGRVGVVGYLGGQTRFLAYYLGKREVFEFEIARKHHGAVFGIDCSRTAYSDARILALYGVSHTVYQRHGVDRYFLARARDYAVLQTKLSVAVQHDTLDSRSADVDSYIK